MSAWSHLPNAKHIDWVLDSLKENPEAWSNERDLPRDAAYNAAWNAARNAAYNAAWDATRGAAWNAAWDATRGAAWDAIAALIAWDHCEKYLHMTPDELMIWWKLSDDPACLLLMPMIKVLNERLVTST